VRSVGCMSTPARSRGRPSPAVYRRRRLVVLLGLLLVIAAIVLLIARPWGSGGTKPRAGLNGAATAQSSDIPVPQQNNASLSAGPSAVPSTASAHSVAGAPCIALNVLVEAITDKTVYSAGERPQLSLKVTNNGPVSCALNVGTAQQDFTITSGSDVFWRSTDCQVNPSDTQIMLAAGQSLSSSASLTWDRTRSAKDTCGGARPSAPEGGASYHLSVTLDGITSTQTKQFQLL